MKREVVPHYVGGRGQPTYPMSKSCARMEMLKHMPWSKCNPLPEMNDTTILELFEHFYKSAHCPLSVLISLERTKNRNEMRKNGISEPVSEDTLESQHVYSDIDEETKDLVNIANNLLEISNIYE
jgi:hypothetical protein